MKSEHYNISGCILKTPDKRNFKLGQVFNLPKLKDLPREFCLPKRPIKDQGGSDKCTAYASCSASELQEDVELNPDFTFAVGKDIEGNPDSWGCDIESMLKAHTKIGAIEQKDVPQNFVPNSTEARYLKNWDTSLVEKAHLNKKETYFEIEGPYDAFDNIKASIWYFRDTKKAAIIGVVWSWGNKTYIDSVDDDGGGHCIHIIGVKLHKGKEYLIVPNSYGENFGDKGYNYLSREVINHYVDMYGAYMLVDMEREDAEWYINNKIKKDDNWLVQFFKLAMGRKLLTLLQELLFRTKQEEVKKKSMNEQLYLKAKEKLGTDFTPDWVVPDEFSCAFALSTILKELVPTLPIIVNTGELYRYMKSSPLFEEIPQPIDKIEKGSIIIAPTGMNTRPDIMPNGHCFIAGENEVYMSNSSFNGLWSENYTRESARQRYAHRGGFPLFVFKLK